MVPKNGHPHKNRETNDEVLLVKPEVAAAEEAEEDTEETFKSLKMAPRKPTCFLDDLEARAGQNETIRGPR